MDRKETARRLNISSDTLTVWACTKRYDLRPFIYNERIHYSKTYLICHFLNRPDNLSILDEPLLDRAEAAVYLDCSFRTLAVWDCLKRYDLRPMKVGNRVRYSKPDLKNFLNEQLQAK